MDGARFVSTVRGDNKDVVTGAARGLAVAGTPGKTDSDDAVKLSLQSKLELISDVKELQANTNAGPDESAFAPRSLRYINKLANKVQKLLGDDGTGGDLRKEQKVQELLSELARVVGYSGGSGEFQDLAQGATQISNTLDGVLRRGDSTEAFADSLSSAGGFYGARAIEKVRAGAAESISRFANNLSDIHAVVGSYVEGRWNSKQVSDEVARLSESALKEIGLDEAGNPKNAVVPEVNIVAAFQNAIAAQDASVLNIETAKKLLGKLVGQFKSGVNLDDLVRAGRDKVA